jgi:hypothetical protein
MDEIRVAVHDIEMAKRLTCSKITSVVPRDVDLRSRNS